MLVLSRKLGQKVVIGGEITVTVLDVRGDRVRLGIEAPKEVPVHREEVRQRIEAQPPDVWTTPVAGLVTAVG